MHNYNMIDIHPSPLVRTFLLFVGIFALVLGVIGVFVPLLPTTPFLLLASYSFARSNNRFNDWLLTNRFFGKHLQNYIKRKTVKSEIKWITIAVLWTTILVSLSVIHTPVFVKVLLILIATGVSVHLFTLKGSE